MQLRHARRPAPRAWVGDPGSGASPQPLASARHPNPQALDVGGTRGLFLPGDMRCTLSQTKSSRRSDVRLLSQAKGQEASAGGTRRRQRLQLAAGQHSTLGRRLKTADDEKQLRSQPQSACGRLPGWKPVSPAEDKGSGCTQLALAKEKARPQNPKLEVGHTRVDTHHSATCRPAMNAMLSDLNDNESDQSPPCLARDLENHMARRQLWAPS